MVLPPLRKVPRGTVRSYLLVLSIAIRLYPRDALNSGAEAWQSDNTLTVH